jgi:hypothetical protein
LRTSSVFPPLRLATHSALRVTSSAERPRFLAISSAYFAARAGDRQPVTKDSAMTATMVRNGQSLERDIGYLCLPLEWGQPTDDPKRNANCRSGNNPGRLRVHPRSGRLRSRNSDGYSTSGVTRFEVGIRLVRRMVQQKYSTLDHQKTKSVCDRVSMVRSLPNQDPSCHRRRQLDLLDSTRL